MENGDTCSESTLVFVQFRTENGSDSGSPIQVPVDFTPESLAKTINVILEKEDEDATIYNFFIDENQILDTIEQTLSAAGRKPADLGTEDVISIMYQPQAVFRVRPVTRCTSSVPGHKAPVLVTLFSPDAKFMASGSGDACISLWDLNTEMPQHNLNTGHSGAILCLSWSPDGEKLASACKQGSLCIWCPVTGKQLGRTMNKINSTNKNKENRCIRSIAWRPLHIDSECRLVVAGYQDSSVVIWDTVLSRVSLTLSGHTRPVTCLRWGGSDLIYTCSQDCSIRVWRCTDGALCRTLSQHGHWVNTLALSTDYVIRTGAFDPAKATLVKEHHNKSRDELQATAQAMYDSVKNGEPERLAAGSDDNTLSLWTPETDKKPLCPRMTGHMAVVNDVRFSPDGRLLASASFDHSIKIWDGHTGKFLASLFGHVQDVYLVSWSSDSRLLVSGSKDSTIKLWSVSEVRRPQSSTKKKRFLLQDLPGHADAVYALDWSPDGQRVVSGGKDKVIKMWRS